MKGRTLTIHPVFLVFAMGVLWLLVSLGNWQSDRAAFKEERQKHYAEQDDQRGVELAALLSVGFEPYTKTWVRGRFIDGAPLLYLDNRSRRGVHGFQVLGVFRARGIESPVLVNLGWLAQRPERRDLPPVGLPEGEIELMALATLPPEKIFRLGPDEEPVSPEQWIIQAVEIGDLSERLGYGLASLVLLLRPEQNFGLLREWKPTYVVTPEKHRGYAFQWYSLAVAWVFLVVWVGLRGEKPQQDHDNT